MQDLRPEALRLEQVITKMLIIAPRMLLADTKSEGALGYCLDSKETRNASSFRLFQVPCSIVSCSLRWTLRMASLSALASR